MMKIVTMHRSFWILMLICNKLLADALAMCLNLYDLPYVW